MTSQSQQSDSDYRPDGLPKVVGLCPNPGHSREFYMPHGGICPYCDFGLIVYAPVATTGTQKPPQAGHTLPEDEDGRADL